MTTQERIYTADDLWEISHLPENSGRRFELVKGELVEMSPSGGEHGDIASELNMQIRFFVKQHKLGYVTAAETGYVLFSDPEKGDTIRAPDVGFVAKHRVPDRLPKKYVPLPPDLAVEVVSPNDTASEINDKINEYLRAGVRMIIFVYPNSRSVNVHSSTNVLRLNEDDTLGGGDVLPGFTLPVRDIFPT